MNHDHVHDHEPETLDVSEAIPAAQAEIEPEHPKATPGIGGEPPNQEIPEGDNLAAAPAPAPAPAAEAPPMDKKGRPFDPAKHAPGPTGRGELTTRGTWKLKGERGRPYRKGEGKEAAPAAEAPADPQEGTEAPAAAAPEPPPSSWIGRPPGGDDLAAVDAVNLGAAPMDDLALEDYKSTAEAVARAQFGVAQIFIGKAWESAPTEHRQWVDAWQAALFEWRAPRVGAAASLVVLAVTSWAKRRDDPETKTIGRRVIDWFRQMIGKPARVRDLDDRPAPPPPAAPAAPPAPTPAPAAAFGAAPAPSPGAWG